MVDQVVLRSCMPCSVPFQVRTLLAMAAVYHHVCQGACGKPFISNRNRPRKYCSKSCYGVVSTWTVAQVRFHAKRAGSIKQLCKHLGIKVVGLYKTFPPRDIDKLERFEMVNIGGVLTKKCPTCEVTWPLDQFRMNNGTKSGVSGSCESCKSKEYAA